jgi:hypothetical protein
MSVRLTGPIAASVTGAHRPNGIHAVPLGDLRLEDA